MSDIIKIKEKIAKLREMTGSPNANEAAVALNMMHDLLMQYNLTESEITINKTEIKEEEYTSGKAEREHETALACAVARYNLCDLYTLYNHHYEGGRKHQTFKAILVGKEHNMEACKIMCDYVFEAMEKGAKELKGQGRETVFSYKKSFCISLSRRLYALKKEEEMSEIKTDCRDLVIKTDADIKEHFKGMNLKQGKPLNTNVKDMVGFLKGQLDAQNLNLNKQIATKGNSKPTLVL